MAHTEPPRAWVVCLQTGILILCLSQPIKLGRLSSVPKEAKFSILSCVPPVVRTHILFFFFFFAAGGPRPCPPRAQPTPPTPKASSPTLALGPTFFFLNPKSWSGSGASCTRPLLTLSATSSFLNGWTSSKPSFHVSEGCFHDTQN